MTIPSKVRAAAIIALMFFAVSSGVALAQTAEHGQAVDKTDPCDAKPPKMNPHALYFCGMGAWDRQDYLAAIKWFTEATKPVDPTQLGYPGEDDEPERVLSASLLGEMYKKGEGVPADYVMAYCWYDISAAIEGALIDKLPPSTGPLPPATNREELTERDNVVDNNDGSRRMTASQIAAGQACSRNWQKTNH